MDRPQIFLAPCASERPKEHFERTILQGVPAERYGQFTDRDSGDSVGLWGVTEGNASIWESIEPGDYLLFYFGNKEYRYVTEVLGTEHNREFAVDLWPNYGDSSAGGDDAADPWEYLIYLDDPVQVDIESSEIHTYAGHKKSFPQKFMPLNEDAVDAIEEEHGSVHAYFDNRRPNPTVWIEKTEQEGRRYKQDGELALGRALIAPSLDKGGHKRYETLRDAEIGDVVLHLLQEREEVVGLSRIASALQEDFEGPPDNRWTVEQEEEGGYRRDLEGYVELEDPIDIYDDVLSNESYTDVLHEIREQHDGKIIYNKRLSLNQGHYFTEVPEDLLGILASESDDLPEKLTEYGVTVVDSPTKLPEPVESYDTVSEAMEDIRTRLEVSTVKNWIASAVTETVLEDWSQVLTQIQPGVTVTEPEAVRLRQIRDLFEGNRTRLRENADELGSGTLQQLSKPQTLFVALLRDLQEEVGLGTNINQVKIKVILNEEYEVGETEDDTGADEVESDEEDRGSEATDLSHPLLTKLAGLSDGTPIRKFTAPPEYWLTALQYGTVSFEEDHHDIWEAVRPGEIVLLHSRASPGDESLPEQESGILGAGIIGEKTRKDDRWWVDETEADPFPYLATFDRLFVTSDLENLDLETPVGEQSRDKLGSQLEALTTDILDFSHVQSICEETNGIGFPAQGAHATFRDEEGNLDHDRPRALLETLSGRLAETRPFHAHAQFAGELPPDLFEGLYFPDGGAEDILEQIEAAIASGKHIILTGPPGTGKTEIARQVCSYLVAKYPYLYTEFQLTTATADWSTFDTVGGYMPSESEETGDHLSFTPGVVLNRLQDRRTGRQENEPIVIDELNRADIDKAFGQLFTLLSGQSVQLPFTRGGEEIELLSAEELSHGPERHQYVVPNSWRIFATMNTYDKTSLYEMSYAFMRRFAFIRVGPPELPEKTDDEEEINELDALMAEYESLWEIEVGREERTDVGRVWRAMNHAVEDRSIGPAIVRDMLSYIAHDDDRPFEERLTRSVVSYIFPQLEGVPKREQIVREIAAVERVDERSLNDAAIEMLQVNFLRDE